MLNPITLKKALNYPLSDEDIQYILKPNKTNIVQYPDLVNVDDINTIFDKFGRCIIFIPLSTTFGHWCCLLKKPNNIIDWFDPYGLAPDTEKKWISKDVLIKLHEDKPLLTNLLRKTQEENGTKILYNRHKWESERSGISTCGRWVALVCMLYNKSFDQINKMIKDSNLSPDTFVTNITFNLLHK
jgi:hypothetical protein